MEEKRVYDQLFSERLIKIETNYENITKIIDGIKIKIDSFIEVTAKDVHAIKEVVKDRAILNETLVRRNDDAIDKVTSVKTRADIIEARASEHIGALEKFTIKTIDLSKEVGKLQAELNSYKLVVKVVFALATSGAVGFVAFIYNAFHSLQI